VLEVDSTAAVEIVVVVDIVVVVFLDFVVIVVVVVVVVAVVVVVIVVVVADVEFVIEDFACFDLVLGFVKVANSGYRWRIGFVPKTADSTRVVEEVEIGIGFGFQRS